MTNTLSEHIINTSTTAHERHKMKNEYDGTAIIRYEVRVFNQTHPPGHWIQVSGTPVCHSQQEAEAYMALIKLGRFRFPNKIGEVPTSKPEFQPADALYRIIKVTTQYEIIYTTETTE